jgi:hypothetical protein
VQLARRAGQQRARPAATVPPAGEAEEAAAQDVAGEVLLPDRDLAALPALAELVQVGQHHPADDGLDRQRREHAVEGGVRPGLVERVERRAQLAGAALERRSAGVGPRDIQLGLGEREARGLGRRQPAVEICAHRGDALLILGGVEAKAAVGALRAQQPIAALPCPQQLRADAGPPAQLADPQVPAVRRHAVILQTLYRLLTIVPSDVRSLYKPYTKELQHPCASCPYPTGRGAPRW